MNDWMIACCLLSMRAWNVAGQSCMHRRCADGWSAVQLIARHPLRLKSSWDTYPGVTDQSGGQQTQQPFSTWKFRSDGESKRIIDFIW